VLPESKISSTSVLSKKTQPPVIITLSDEEYSQDGNGVIDLDPAVQAASTEASRPKPVSVKTVANDKVSLNEPSSVKATKTDKHTHQNQPMKSSHSKQPPIDTPPSSQDSTPKAGWDNSTNPIDNPLWAKDCASRAADERGIINFHNLPKQTYSSPVSSSFNRQMANIKQTSHSTQVIQPPGTKGPASEDAIMSPMEKHIMNDFPKTLSAKPRSQNESSKAAPHMKAQIASVPANPGDGTQESEVKAEKVAPHLRKSISNSQAGNQEQYTETTAEQTIAAVKNYTPPPHLQGHRASKASANRESRSGPKPNAYWIETGPKMSRGNINIDEELAAVQHIADTESNAEVTAAMAEAEVRENDERIAAALQEESSQNKSLDTPSVKVTGESQERPNSIPPHLRKPKPKALTLNTELKTPSSSSAVIQPRKSNQDHQGSGETNPTRTRKGTTKAQQNATVAPPSSGVTLINGVVSTVWKGKEIEKGIDPDNDPSKLVGWDGKMVPALLGDDWEDRRQYNSKGIEKLSNIEDWTVTHAADKENGITGEEGIPTSPVGAKHPETLPNPDEFNQAKRHLSAHTAIEAFAKRSASGKSSSPVEDGATREGRRTNRRLKKEKHTSMELPPNEYAPAANIYLRPADMQDMRQVASLHNHYVRESTWANEVEEWDELYWRSRLQECYDERDPFLVAIHTGDKAVKDGREVHRKKNKSETVVGFAFASDYGLSRTAYRFTVEVELWVHPDHRRQGIGRSMLDRILTALDPGYIVKECAPFRCKDRQEMVKWGGGGVRTVKTLLINMLYTETCEQALEWRKKWLSDNQFDYQGTLSDIGYKFSRL